MSIKIDIQKTFVDGPFEGIVITDSMSHTDWDRAKTWARRVNKAQGVPYVVDSIHNLETNERWYL